MIFDTCHGRHLEPSPVTHASEDGRKIRNGMEFVPRVEISIFCTKKKQAITDHILYRYNFHDKIFLPIDLIHVPYKISAEYLVIHFAYFSP